MDRRTFLRGIGGFSVGVGLPARPLLAGTGTSSDGDGPYGPLDDATADDLGIVVPDGFRVRLVAASGEPVRGTDYVWPRFPDGAAAFRTDDGWIYVCNSEVPSLGGGGVGAVRFVDGEIADAYPVLTGTTANCAGGPTPWGTWLSCEEYELDPGLVVEGVPRGGMVWETDPTGRTPGRAHPAMGVFQHEAAAVDPIGERVYLTEDQVDGRLYRFTPDDYPDLSAGRLEVAAVDDDGGVTWLTVPDPLAIERPVRRQVADTTVFAGGEGIWYHDGRVVLTTKHDVKVHEIDVVADRHRVLYDGRAVDAPILDTVDNVTVHEPSGDVFVAEDGSNPPELVMISADGGVHAFARLLGDVHRNSEVTGPCFSPSGTRLYFSSQRGLGSGLTFEVVGPFRSLGRPAVPTTTIAAASTSTTTTSTSTTIAAASTPPPAETSGRAESDDEGVGGVVPIGGAAVAAGAATAWILHRRRSVSADADQDPPDA